MARFSAATRQRAVVDADLAVVRQADLAGYHAHAELVRRHTNEALAAANLKRTSRFTEFATRTVVAVLRAVGLRAAARKLAGSWWTSSSAAIPESYLCADLFVRTGGAWIRRTSC
jgi:hypothetical protein